ncbi:MAG: hypothetical protein CVU39_19000 [Chloroflexi bacterium HGW-Chloroflexi-10]|nr:MAG: hypothetical protein CVU39_19000 [Chloroflexi bacterium HGW-Chloroflexi-10]
MSEMDEFLNQPLLARLATLNPDTLQPHVVPVWYVWDGISLWISGFSSTRKMKELAKNPRCSVIIDVNETQGGMRAVLLEGEAEVITSPRTLVEEKSTWIYIRYLGNEGVLAADPQSWIKDPENMLVKLTPALTKTWK